jgi:thymidylate synthase (FAD)
MLHAVKGQSWQVLDHGYIKLLDFMGTDESIVEAARTSTRKGFQAWGPHEKCRTCGRMIYPDGRVIYTPFQGLSCDKKDAHCIMEKQPGDETLLDYLWRHGHHTPFEMVELKVEVKAPILCWRQIMRHRTFSFNEASGRYAKMPNEHYVPSRERICSQSKKNKQGSADPVDHNTAENFRVKMEAQQWEIYSLYDDCVALDIANETARLNTPVSRYSTAVMKTDLRNWFHFLELRMDGHAQWETRQYANVVGDIVSALFPRAWAVFQEHTLFGTRFSRTEMGIIQSLVHAFQNQMPSTDILRLEAEERGLSGSRLDEFLKKLSAA